MIIIKEFELEGGYAIEDYPSSCKDLAPGDRLDAALGNGGLTFFHNGHEIGVLTGEASLLPSALLRQGIEVCALVTAVRRTEALPAVFAELRAGK